MMIILEVIITVLSVEVDSAYDELKKCDDDYDDMDDESYKESPTEKYTHILRY